MPRHITLDDARGAVLDRTALRTARWRDRDITRALSEGSLRRLQRNRYVLGADWADLWPESRHRIEVCAAFEEMRGGGAVASHESAAVVHGLPLYRHVPGAVHVTVPSHAHPSSRAGLRRHADLLTESDVAVVSGIRCTTLDRTVFDVARTLAFEAAVVIADAALRRIAYAGGEYDAGRAERWRERQLARAAAARGMRGVRQAVEVILFADGRAESPAESVARVQLARLGFVRIRLQVPVAGPDGRPYRVDMEIEDVGVLLEIDGVAKYGEPALLSGRTTQQVLLDEKRREDWIRGTTQKRFVRAEAAHVASPGVLAARLASFGILAPSAPPSAHLLAETARLRRG